MNSFEYMFTYHEALLSIRYDLEHFILDDTVKEYLNTRIQEGFEELCRSAEVRAEKRQQDITRLETNYKALSKKKF